MILKKEKKVNLEKPFSIFGWMFFLVPLIYLVASFYFDIGGNISIYYILISLIGLWVIYLSKKAKENKIYPIISLILCFIAFWVTLEHSGEFIFFFTIFIYIVLNFFKKSKKPQQEEMQPQYINKQEFSNNNIGLFILGSLILITLGFYIGNKEQEVAEIQNIEVKQEITREEVEEVIIKETKEEAQQAQEETPQNIIIEVEPAIEKEPQEIVAIWNEEPVKLNKDIIIYNYIQEYNAQLDSMMQEKKIPYEFYSLGKVLNGEYAGRRIISIRKTEDFPSYWIRAIEYKNQYIILDNYSYNPINGLENYDINYEYADNITISNFYKYNSIDFSNSSLIPLLGENYKQISELEDYETIKIDNSEDMIYEENGAFWIETADGLLQRYVFDLSEIGCNNDTFICSININDEIVGSYQVSQFRGMWQEDAPGYLYNEGENLIKIGEDENGFVFYKPTNDQEYFTEKYDKKVVDMEEYSSPVIVWESPLGYLIELIKIDYLIIAF
jgi:hypothetical protein